MTPPLLGFCSDLDPPAAFAKRVNNATPTSFGGGARGMLRRSADLTAGGVGAAARRASKASKALLTKLGSEQGGKAGNKAAAGAAGAAAAKADSKPAWLSKILGRS